MPLKPGAVPAKDMGSREWAKWCKEQNRPRPEDDYANDAAAEAAGVPVGELYHTAGVVKVRRS